MNLSFIPRFRLRRFAAGVFILCGVSHGSFADVVTAWNLAMTNYAAPLSPVPLAPFVETRVYAMVHIAQFDAITEARGYHTHKWRHAGPGSPDAAGAQAAHDVLVHEFSAGAATFDALLASQLAAIPDGPDKISGIMIGADSAAAMLAARANDGSATANGPYIPGTEPGDYQPTPPFDGPPFNGYVDAVNWGKVTPFTMKSASQFRPPPPYRVTDLNYTFDFNEIKALGSMTSVGRGPDQTHLAIFWSESGGLGWNRIARNLSADHSLDLNTNARLFAALNAALADGYISSFDAKFAYNFWRPVTAIRRADTDGNGLTTADATWTELLFPTPPVPDYPSAHAIVGTAAATVLISIFGDENHFIATSTALPGSREFTRISDAAKENAISRMMGGIHFRLACETGYAQGSDLGGWIVQYSMLSQGH